MKGVTPKDYLERASKEDDSISHKEEKTTKSKIIPEEWKSDIDAFISKELIGANRYFAKTNPKIVELVKREAVQHPIDFLRELKQRWKWHHEFYEDMLEPAMSEVIEENNQSISPRQALILKQIYQTSALVDHATLPMTAAIKPHLNEWTKEERHPPMDKEEKNLLLSMSKPSFWITYAVEHLKYVLALQTDPEQADLMKAKLLRKYHADDERIFAGRMKKYQKFREYSPQRLEEYIDSFAPDEGEHVKHVYFTLEKPLRKAIRDILEYDNIEEYSMITALEGISGFVLRKKVIQYLTDTKLLEVRDGIYSYTDKEIVDGLERLKILRLEFMDKKINNHWVQKNEESCTAACGLMAIEFINGEPPTNQREEELFQRIRAKRIPGSFFSLLSKELAEKGAETILIHERDDMFTNERGTFDASLFRKLMYEYYKGCIDAQSAGAKVTNGEKIDADRIRKYLSDDYIIIVAGQISGGILHAVLVTGYTKEGLLVHDPIFQKQRHVKNNVFNRFLSTDIGSWMISVRRSQSAVDSLMGSLPAFNEKAKKYLNDNEKEVIL